MAPPNLRLSDCPMPGFPRVHSHNTLRRAILLLPTRPPTLTSTPIRIPPPPPSSLWRVLHPVPPAGQATSRWLNFGGTPAQPTPRVPCVCPPARICPPFAPPAILPVCEPISHRTHSHAQAPLALSTSGRPYHKQVKYHILTAKATWPVDEPLAFASLCKAFDMKPAEVEGFALTLEDRPAVSPFPNLEMQHNDKES